MIIKRNRNHTKLEDNTSSILNFLWKNYKLIFLSGFLVLYTIFVFFIGGSAYKSGFFGQVLVPLIETNIKIPVHYLKSLTANTEKISLDVKHKNFMQLYYKRQQALADGVLHVSDSDFVPANLRWKDRTYRANIRLKGDLGDHWTDDSKWSFRIKLKDKDAAVLGMSKFSLQHPRTRGFLNDWILHQLLHYLDDFIVLRYQFVEVSINGKDLGVYLLEEHFDSNLLENNGYLDSPIIRIYDHLLWYNVDPVYGFTGEHLNEHYALSPIDAFNTNYINRNDKLFNNFKIAKDLLESFRRKKLPTHKVFNTDKLAKLFAVIDLLGYHHSTAYSNIRFYFNPVTGLLDPIGYDNTFIFEAKELQGQDKTIKLVQADYEDRYVDYNEYQIWYETFFSDSVFFKKYIYELNKISEKKFLDEFLDSVDESLNEQLKILYKSFPGYQFKATPILYKNQEFIRKMLNPLNSVQTYFSKYTPENNTLTLQLGNVTEFPVSIQNLKWRHNVFQIIEDNSILNSKKKFEFLEFKNMQFSIPKNIAWNDTLIDSLNIHYNIIGLDQDLYSNIYRWEYFNQNDLKNDIFRRKPNFRESDFLIINDSEKTIYVKNGNWTLKQDLIIPENYTLLCYSGTTINLINKSKILSYSPCQFIGREESPIKIWSEDSSGQGILILNTTGKTIFEHTLFENLSDLNYNNWTLEGSLAIYESELIMNYCEFKNCISTNSLYLIRSKFIINNCNFNHNKGSSIALFFSIGNINDLEILNNIEECIVSIGSELKGKNILIKDAQNCALNFSDGSKAILENCIITDVSSGIKCSNKSTVNLSQSSINNAKFGVLVFSDKEQFGPAYAELNSVQTSNIESLFMVEENSRLINEGNKISPLNKREFKEHQKVLNERGY